MDQIFYTIPEVCRLASVGRTKFYELAASGEIPIRKIGKKSLVAAADLKRWADRLPPIGPNTKPTHRADPQRAAIHGLGERFCAKGKPLAPEGDDPA